MFFLKTTWTTFIKEISCHGCRCCRPLFTLLATAFPLFNRGLKTGVVFKQFFHEFVFFIVGGGVGNTLALFLEFEGGKLLVAHPHQLLALLKILLQALPNKAAHKNISAIRELQCFLQIPTMGLLQKFVLARIDYHRFVGVPVMIKCGNHLHKSHIVEGVECFEIGREDLRRGIVEVLIRHTMVEKESLLLEKRCVARHFDLQFKPFAKHGIDMFNEFDGTVHVVEHVHHHLPFAFLLLLFVDERRRAEGKHDGEGGSDEGHEQILQPRPPHKIRYSVSVGSQFVISCSESHNHKIQAAKIQFFSLGFTV